MIACLIPTGSHTVAGGLSAANTPMKRREIACLIPTGSHTVAGGMSAANTPGHRTCANLRPQRGRIHVCDPSGIVARLCSRSGGAPLRDNPRLPYAIPPGSTCNDPNGIFAHRSQRDHRATIPTGSYTVAGGLSAANTPGHRTCANLRPQRGRIHDCDPSGIVARSCSRSGGAPLRDDPRLPYAIPPGSICFDPSGINLLRSLRDPRVSNPTGSAGTDPNRVACPLQSTVLQSIDTFPFLSLSTWKLPCQLFIPFISILFFLPNIESLGSTTNGLATCTDTLVVPSKVWALPL